MRSLIVGLLVFLVAVGVEAKGGKSVETELLFHANIGVLPSEHALPEVKGVVLRWGRQYWPISEFGKCFAELQTPTGTSRTYGYWGRAVASWQGETYIAHCFNGPTVFWSKVLKK